MAFLLGPWRCLTLVLSIRTLQACSPWGRGGCWGLICTALPLDLPLQLAAPALCDWLSSASWRPWFPPQRTGHPRKKLTCLLAGCPGSSALNPKMFLSLILAQAGMWLPRPVAKELFWGLLLEEGLDPPHRLPQALASRSPLALAAEQAPSRSYTSCQRGLGGNTAGTGAKFNCPKVGLHC